jgi:integrase/recombinase XerC/integrase/recombinase XerD
VELERFLPLFLASQDIALRSKKTYENALKQFLLWYKKEKFETPRRESILLYKYALDTKKISAFTKATYLVVVRRFFFWLEQENICQNVTRGIKGIKRQLKNHQKDSLPPDSVHKILSKINQNKKEGVRDFALINMLVRTGLRLKEIAGASVGDIRREQGRAVLWVQGKGRSSKDDFVVLTDEVLKPLNKYLGLRGDNLSSDEALFASLSDRNYGKQLTINSLSRLIKQRLQKAGFDSRRITAHSLRHTFGVLAMKAGASLYEVQLAMRHSNPSTTQLYLGDIERMKRLEGSPEKKISELLKVGNTAR